MSEIESKNSQDAKTYHYGVIADPLNTLLGKLLTLVDATFHDVQQRKAFKDIIKTSFYEAVFAIKSLENKSIFPTNTHIAEILKLGSRPIDEELDLDSQGKFK